VRNLIYQPGFSNWNMGLFKSFPLKRIHQIQFRGGSLQRLEPSRTGAATLVAAAPTNIGLNPTNLSTFCKVLAKGSGSSAQRAPICNSRCASISDSCRLITILPTTRRGTFLRVVLV